METKLVSYLVCLLLLFCSIHAKSIGTSSDIAEDAVKSIDELTKMIENAINKNGNIETEDETKINPLEPKDENEAKKATEGKESSEEYIDELLNKANEKEAAKADGLEKVDGDMILPAKQYREAITGKNVQGDLISNERRYWDDRRTDPDGVWKSGIIVVPYFYGQEVNQAFRDAIAGAVAEYNQKTCIRFVPRTNEQNSLELVAKGGCYSYVGKQPNPTQEVSLGRGCEYTGIAIHELMHAIGYYHEQSRPDRDLFVRIDFDNVQENREFNFEKLTTKDQGTTYDYESVMHYSAYAFAKDRSKPTIYRLQGNGQLGQRRGLSAIDEESINKLYCDGDGTTEPTTGGNCQLPVTDPAFCPSVRGTGLCAYCIYNQACPNDCVDSSQSIARNCPAWANSGFCKVNQYTQYMGRTCGDSCKNKCKE